jgi:hypothetical protein
MKKVSRFAMLSRFPTSVLRLTPDAIFLYRLLRVDLRVALSYIAVKI